MQKIESYVEDDGKYVSCAGRYVYFSDGYSVTFGSPCEGQACLVEYSSSKLDHIKSKLNLNFIQKYTFKLDV